MAKSRVLTEHDCLDIARRHFGAAGAARVVGWSERRAGDGPEGFMGKHVRAEVAATAGDDSDAEKIDAFVKALPDNENHRVIIAECGIFRKEAAFFCSLVAEWEKRGIIPSTSVAERQKENPDGLITWNCRWYIARDDLLVLEDLAPLGYTTHHPRHIFSYDQCVSVLKMVANFHAASLIYEEEKSAELGREFRIGKEHPGVVSEPFYVHEEGHLGRLCIEATVQPHVECAELLPLCADPAVLRKVKEALPRVMKRMYELVGASKKHRNVICHADLWTNNILFAEDGDVKLVDFQLLRYAPPAHDIYIFLHNTTRREFRLRHEKALLEEYWLALKSALGRRGLDIENVLPRSDFDASLPEQKLAGRLSGIYVVHFTMAGEQAVRRLLGDAEYYARVLYDGEGRREYVVDQFKNDEEYRERVAEALDELIECDILASSDSH